MSADAGVYERQGGRKRANPFNSCLLIGDFWQKKGVDVATDFGRFLPVATSSNRPRADV
jgi:hypothetical protein